MEPQRLAVTKALFNKLAKSKAKDRTKVLKKATNEQLKGLCEVCLNIVHGNIKLSKKRYAAFKRQKDLMHKLSNKKLPLYAKRKVINQKGGFLGTLAAFSAPLLTQLAIKGIGKLVKRYKRKRRRRQS